MVEGMPSKKDAEIMTKNFKFTNYIRIISITNPDKKHFIIFIPEVNKFLLILI